MITREQFEAHVRAEAAKEFPLVKHDEGPINFSVNDRQRDHRGTYVAARIEHEWPLVEALQKWPDLFKEINDQKTSWPGEIDDFDDAAKEALSPYTTKPIEP